MLLNLPIEELAEYGELYDLAEFTDLVWYEENNIKDWHHFIKYCIENDFHVVKEQEGEYFIIPIEAVRFNYAKRKAFLPVTTFESTWVKTKKPVAEKLKIPTIIEHVGERYDSEDGSPVPVYLCEALLRYNIAVEELPLAQYEQQVEETFTVVNLSTQEGYIINTKDLNDLTSKQAEYNISTLRELFLNCHSKGYEQIKQRHVFSGNYTTKWEVNTCSRLGLVRYAKDAYVDIRTSDIVYYKHDKLQIEETSKYTFEQNVAIFESYLWCLTSQETPLVEDNYVQAFKDLGNKVDGKEHRHIKVGQQAPLYIQHYYMHKPITLRKKTYEGY